MVECWFPKLHHSTWSIFRTLDFIGYIWDFFGSYWTIEVVACWFPIFTHSTMCTSRTMRFVTSWTFRTTEVLVPQILTIRRVHFYKRFFRYFVMVFVTVLCGIQLNDHRTALKQLLIFSSNRFDHWIFLNQFLITPMSTLFVWKNLLRNH